MLLSIPILILLMIAAPVIVGLLFEGAFPKNDCALPEKLLFSWISGQCFLWAVFLLLAVPLILKGQSFSVLRTAMTALIPAFCILSLLFALHKRKKNGSFFGACASFEKPSLTTLIAWGIFGVLLLFQLVMAGIYTYADGDDAFYVAMATITPEGGPMYLANPYTGGSTGIWFRYGLAPFPLWIRYLADLSGLRAVTIAHVVLPIVLIAMAYGLYALLGSELLSGEKKRLLPVYLIFTEVLVLFGNYSIYSPENFLIARSRQGKALLASLLLPAVIYLLLRIFRHLKEDSPIPAAYYLLLPCIGLSGCLASTGGTVLVCMLIGIAGPWSVILYRKIRHLPLLALSCLPGVVFALLYLYIR